ncbi:hypothetical protein JQC92_02600 [Shewanella sp. 202IG2-18]|uniref:hypothetical protein n=1 Tax=Parashewanella hymeniacidonis TaxID=2807618 RepID=UPI0019621B7D|nr:hypothetical protein [Parashewanella hymeniacidonis]MBM7070932.1 hypothetical protein [Parashewanella hymeniacidonis]
MSKQTKITTDKAMKIAKEQGYEFSGFVLVNDKGERAIVENGAVRHLSNEEMWELMHSPVEEE